MTCLPAWEPWMREGHRTMPGVGLPGVGSLTSLDTGAMGEVWRGRSTVTGAPLAVKLLRADVLDPAAVPRFQQEIEVVAGLSHPNVVYVLDVGRTSAASCWGEGTPYLVMELLTGGTLANLAGASWPVLRRALVELLHGLGAAHAAGVVHRDLKPANVLLGAATDARPGLKLCDFGVATLMGRSARSAGSLAYMAPEQLTGGPVGPWSDLYAVGGLAYFLLTGRVPDASGNLRQVVARKLDGPLTLPAASAAVAEWVASLTAPSWRARPRHVGEALDRLLALEGAEVAARAATSEVSETFVFTEGHAPVPDAPQPLPMREPPAAGLRLPEHPPPQPLAPPPHLLAGAGLGVVRLRRASLRGRQTDQQVLWRWLAAPPSPLGLVGPPGAGVRRLAHWLVAAARTAGATAVWLGPGSHLDDALAPWWPGLRAGELPCRRARAAGPVLVVTEEDRPDLPDDVHVLRVGDSGAQPGEGAVHVLGPLSARVVAAVVADLAPVAPWWALSLAYAAEGCPGRAIACLVDDAEAGRLHWYADGWAPADPARAERLLREGSSAPGHLDHDLLSVVADARAGREEAFLAGLHALVERVEQQGHLPVRGVAGFVREVGGLGGLSMPLRALVDGWLRVVDARQLRLAGDPRAGAALRSVLDAPDLARFGRLRALAVLEQVRLADLVAAPGPTRALIDTGLAALRDPRSPVERAGVPVSDAELRAWFAYNRVLIDVRDAALSTRAEAMAEVAEAALAAGVERVAADAAADLAVSLSHSDPVGAVAWARRSVALNQSLRRHSGLADATSTLGHALSAAGSLREALGCFDAAVAAYRRLGSAFEVFALLGAARAHLRLGEAEAARDRLQVALPLARGAGPGVFGYGLRLYAAACFVVGDQHACRQALGSAARVDPDPLPETRELRRNLLEAYPPPVGEGFWALSRGMHASEVSG